MANWTREKQRAYQLEWMRKRREDPEFRKRETASTQRWQAANPLHHAWLQYCRSARQRGLDFTIERERMEWLLSEQCIYCGSEPSPLNGIDRLDNDLGYVEGNVVPCCSVCNRAKHTMSKEEFIQWARRVVRHTQA